MSTTQSTFGIRHLTVVPTNLDAVEATDRKRSETDRVSGDDA